MKKVLAATREFCDWQELEPDDIEGQVAEAAKDHNKMLSRLLELRRAAQKSLHPEGDGSDKPPRSVIEFRLSIGAEDRKSLAWRLRDIADQIEADRVSTSSLWGGAGSHGDYSFDEDRSITIEQYRADLEAWCERKRGQRRPFAQRTPRDEPPANTTMGGA